MNEKPIGVFDSGYGGLTILRELVKRLPQHDFLYLGDNARAPYGDKPFDTVYQYTLEAVEWFFAQGCELVILACNTASAKALRSIQQNDLPRLAPEKRVLGVIRPTSEVIGKYSRSGHVGVLGTRGTVQSESYLIEINKFFPELKVTQEACPEWVGLVEQNKTETAEADASVSSHIQQLMQADPAIDSLLLACTHYPLLINKIRQHAPTTASIISQGDIVADSLLDYLSRHPEIGNKCTQNSFLRFFTTGEVKDFDTHASQFFGAAVSAKKTILP
jgi:glutamate racemase